MHFNRGSGVLLHPTSLPSRFGIGDFGPSAIRFLDFLEAAKQRYWQILPLGPTGYGDSPYQCFSAFAGNPLLISPEILVKEGFLSEEHLRNSPKFTRKIDFQKVKEFKEELLANAFNRFRDSPIEENHSFSGFCENESFWLDDYSHFMAIKRDLGGVAWTNWEEGLKTRVPNAMAVSKKKLSEDVLREKFYQYLFFKQWFDLKAECERRGINVIGDIPIFTAFDSCDVWSNPEEFKLSEDGNPKVVAGVPPDYFSESGQRWGNPIYDWEKMEQSGFGWWKSRYYMNMRLFDIIRIDHFRGFVASWEIPAAEKTAKNGNWVRVPGRALFSELKQEFGNLRVIAEDLGDIDDEVRDLRDSFDFPGMKVLQFAFGGDYRSLDLPHNYKKNCVVYSGTHDNETTNGWKKSQIASKSKSAGSDLGFCLQYLDSDGKDLNWDFIRAAISSVADISIFPLQDIFGLDNRGRMNFPSTTSGNWNWRYKNKDLSSKIAHRLAAMVEMFSRDTNLSD